MRWLKELYRDAVDEDGEVKDGLALTVLFLIVGYPATMLLVWTASIVVWAVNL